jgi:hypothetical protein
MTEPSLNPSLKELLERHVTDVQLLVHGRRSSSQMCFQKISNA